ncbi:MAG: prolyl aminopeptidase [bacterium]|nr:prolyl aminopeptidase [bacterium]
MSSTKDQYLYPPIEPYRTGFLSVYHGHQIYWEESGNPEGLPVFFIHGGPGAGCDTDDRRFLDPKKWRIIIHDQRGCGRSKPLGKLEANNTWALVDDIRTLQKHLKIEKFVLFGGSWGSTLALIYAIHYPRTVAGMSLRGIFLATKKEMDYFYKDGFNGVGIYIPEQWERYISNVPLKHRNDPLSYFLQEITNGNKELARELALFECSNLHLTPSAEKDLEKDLDSVPAMALLESHYFVHNCFIEEGYILKNTGSIAHIPTVIVHGIYDLVCIPLNARLLNKALPQSTLHWTVAGHSSLDLQNMIKLVSETDALYYKITQAS